MGWLGSCKRAKSDGTAENYAYVHAKIYAIPDVEQLTFRRWHAGYLILQSLVPKTKLPGPLKVL